MGLNHILLLLNPLQEILETFFGNLTSLHLKGGVHACFSSAFSAGKLRFSAFSAGKMRFSAFSAGKMRFSAFFDFFKPPVVRECQNHNYMVVTDLNVANHSFMHNLDNPIETY